MNNADIFFFFATSFTLIPFFVGGALWLKSMLDFTRRYKLKYPNANATMEDVNKLRETSQLNGLRAEWAIQSKINQSLTDPDLGVYARHTKLRWKITMIGTWTGFAITAVMLLTHPN